MSLFCHFLLCLDILILKKIITIWFYKNKLLSLNANVDYVSEPNEAPLQICTKNNFFKKNLGDIHLLIKKLAMYEIKTYNWSKRVRSNSI